MNHIVNTGTIGGPLQTCGMQSAGAFSKGNTGQNTNKSAETWKQTVRIYREIISHYREMS